MRFSNPSCPKCRKPATGVVERVTRLTGIAKQDDGSFEWDTEAFDEVCWEDDYPVPFVRGKKTFDQTLFCRRDSHSYYEWGSNILPDTP